MFIFVYLMLAASDPPQVDGTAMQPQQAPAEVSSPAKPTTSSKKMSVSELGGTRAGDDRTDVFVVTEQSLAALNSNNSVTGETVGSGAINLSANAFDGYNGIGNFVLNTGHNNNLQGSLSVQVVITPPSSLP